MKRLPPQFFTVGPFADAEETIQQIGTNLYASYWMEEYFYERQKLQKEYEEAVKENDEEKIKKWENALELCDTALVVSAQLLPDIEDTLS
mgnify:CR=1 FL=1